MSAQNQGSHNQYRYIHNGWDGLYEPGAIIFQTAERVLFTASDFAVLLVDKQRMKASAATMEER